jgi:hypothetical protein
MIKIGEESYALERDGTKSHLKVHKIEIFLASILKFVLFLY